MQKLVDTFIRNTNAFDADAALALFAVDAVIDDVSVGQAFAGKKGIRAYLDQYFVGFRTASTLLSLERLNDDAAIARIDFTGDFGHEIGTLAIQTGAGGLIERIDADLE